jgi:tRNA (cytidine/uridine-2'-O-)-methyltransferase
MFHIILHEPEIPPNTGNVIRLTANTGCQLHLVHPLGFSLDAAQVRRAGLDYHQMARVHEHDSLEACLAAVNPPRTWIVETTGRRCYSDIAYRPGDAFLFGRETKGLPEAALNLFPPDQVVHIPMRPGNRSLNLSNSVALVIFEAWRQQGFSMAGDDGNA